MSFFKKKEPAKIWIWLLGDGETMHISQLFDSADDFKTNFVDKVGPKLQELGASLVSHDPDNPTVFRQENPVTIDMKKKAHARLILFDRNGKGLPLLAVAQVDMTFSYMARILFPDGQTASKEFATRSEAVGFIERDIIDRRLEMRRDEGALDSWEGVGKDTGVDYGVILYAKGKDETDARVIPMSSGDLTQIFIKWLPDWLRSMSRGAESQG